MRADAELQQEAVVPEDLVLEEDLLDDLAPGCRRSSRRGASRAASKSARVIGGQPRSRPILFIAAATCGNDSSSACCDVSAT